MTRYSWETHGVCDLGTYYCTVCAFPAAMLSAVPPPPPAAVTVTAGRLCRTTPDAAAQPTYHRDDWLGTESTEGGGGRGANDDTSLVEHKDIHYTYSHVYLRTYPGYVYLGFGLLTSDRLPGADPGGGGGGRWVRRPPLGRRDQARVPSSQGQKEGTLVSLEWLFNTIKA